jgi:O-antigen/teichoic acid export membrane protein
MGIIARQSSKKTIVSFIGVFIGALSILFVYPREKEIYGLALFLFSSANLLMIFLSAGSLGLVIKYFPVFRRMNISGFNTLIYIIVLVSMLLTSGLLFVFKPAIYALLELGKYDVGLIREHGWSIYLLTLLFILCYLVIYQASNHKRIVVPSIFFELGYKIVLPILIILVFYGLIVQEQFIQLYLLFFALVFMAILFYLAYLKQLRFSRIDLSKLTKKLRREMSVYMLFSGLNRIGSTIVARVDTIMVATLISLNDTGIYGILLFMSNVIDIPVRSINQIAAPVISSSIENNDQENVSSIYKKSSINSLLIGIFIFLLIWGLLPDIFYIMPESEDVSPFRNVFLFLALGKLIDMAFSTNTHILIYSKYFRYNLFFVLFLGTVNVILNYIFILKYGLIGAAVGTAISLVLYNVIKLFFIQVKLNYWPFTVQTLKLAVIAGLFFFAVGFLPSLSPGWGNLLFKGVTITVAFYILIKLFKVDADVIVSGENLLKKFYNKLVK